jgi:hypothetical protein
MYKRRHKKSPPLPPSVGIPTEYLQSTYIGRDEIAICPHNWSVHCNFVCDGKCSERGWACPSPPSPAWANFSIMMECMPESNRCHSVCTLRECWVRETKTWEMRQIWADDRKTDPGPELGETDRLFSLGISVDPPTPHQPLYIVEQS